MMTVTLFWIVRMTRQKHLFFGTVLVRPYLLLLQRRAACDLYGFCGHVRDFGKPGAPVRALSGTASGWLIVRLPSSMVMAWEKLSLYRKYFPIRNLAHYPGN